MSERRNTPQPLIDFRKIREVLAKNRLVWLGTTLLCTLLGLLHVATKQDQWQASQALVVRDEAFGEMGFGPTGRFDNNDALKRSLETILQIAKNQDVVQAALAQVGPPPNATTKSAWPSEDVIERLQKQIRVSAPKGTEFGTSDLVYLSVQAPTRDRAVALTEALCDQLERRMKQLRADHARSIIAELGQKKKLSESDLTSVTTELAKMESDLGSDLGEMRSLSEAGVGGIGNLNAQVSQIRVELREAERVSQTHSELLALLRTAGSDTSLIVATPNRLLEAQPALRRIKDGLVDAQLRTAQLRGNMTDEHPAVRAALLNEDNVRQQLRSEAGNAIAEAEAELAVSKSLVASLTTKLTDVQVKLDRLAAQRAEYTNLVSKVEQRREQLRLCNVALADARGRQEAAGASSLIVRLDDPVTSSRPMGPGRLTVVAGSLGVGLCLGLSFVYLIAPWQEKRNTRGRRQSDRHGRRATDAGESSATVVHQHRYSLDFQPLRDALMSDQEITESEADASLAHLSKLVRSK